MIFYKFIITKKVFNLRFQKYDNAVGWFFAHHYIFTEIVLIDYKKLAFLIESD